MNTDYRSKKLGHLGLVAGMFDELGIASVINNNLSLAEANRNLSAGDSVKAFVLIGLGFVQRALYITPQYLTTISADRLFGKNISVNYFTDDVMGRTLDRIYEYGTTALFSKISKVACEKLSLKPRYAHLDSTSFHVDGVYNSNSELPDEAVIKITKGYSRDHRPELNQAILNLIVENKAGIPILMEAVNGNSSDKTDFPRIVNKFSKNLQTPLMIEYVVADSALYTAGGITKIKSCKWISRVPESIKIAKELIVNVVSEELEDINNGYKIKEFERTYAEIPQRWLLVFSEKAYKRECKTLGKKLLKLTDKELKSFENLENEEFACEEDANKALKKLLKKASLLEVAETSIIKTPKYTGKGRPKKHAKPTRFVYQITGIVSFSSENKNKMQAKKGFFIIATNELDKEKLSSVELFEAYKNQGKVERGFRFLKDPQFMASTLFLKKPERIEALMMIMTLSLLVYAALEYKTRKKLKENNVTFTNQLKKQIQNPTMRWVFFCFKGIDSLYIRGKTGSMILNLTEEQEKIIKLLGRHFENIYF